MENTSDVSGGHTKNNVQGTPQIRLVSARGNRYTAEPHSYCSLENLTVGALKVPLRQYFT